MTADRWARTVRRQSGPGRLLPLGGPYDGGWITEDAARDALRRAAGDVAGVRLGALRIALADPEDTCEPVVPAPPGGLPPGPLRVTADFAADAAGEPLPVVAARLRAALSGAAEWVGLAVAEVDLRVTELWDEEAPGGDTPDTPSGGTSGASGVSEGGRTSGGVSASAVRVTETPDVSCAPDAAPWAGFADAEEVRAAGAALAVPGVALLTRTLGGPGGRAVYLVEEHTAAGEALPRRHARVEIGVAAGHRSVEVARAVRAAVGAALPDRPTVAVLVTAVDRSGE
ncbi:nucleopolyhedrovirus P10 family protein [Streptomyces sp. NPDC047000]|uniref:nucleopolyhedrovirus P10 family protein n=1 Tax=Streptomyces sp. NPDC047000 TaxID=3155474 RepID=UPI00340E6296